MEIGNKIAQLRKNAGLSQDEMAERLFVSRSLVAKWENGRRRPDMGSIEKISSLFGIAPDTIIENDDAVRRELEKCLPKNLSLSSGELAAVIGAFLRTLPERDRKIFVRRYHFFEKPQQIAEEFGLTVNNVGMILFRTRKKLKEALGKETEDEKK